MKMLIRVFLAGCVAVVAAVAGVYFLLNLEGTSQDSYRRRLRDAASARRASYAIERKDQATPRGPLQFTDDTLPFEKGGVEVALKYTGEVRDHRSLRALRDALQTRGPAGLSALTAERDSIPKDPPGASEHARESGLVRHSLGILQLYLGQFGEADATFAEAVAIGRSSNAPREVLAHLTALRGIAALRRGEVGNCVECVGPSSCLFPIAPEAVHLQKEGSRAAVEHFLAFLDEAPGDLRVRWLLNIAYMTLGEYPSSVPPAYLIPIEGFRSELDAGRFENVAGRAGLGARGPNQAGSSAFDDFNNDGRPDLLISSLSAEQGASLFINRGDGTFEDRTAAARFDEQVYSLNLVRTDFNNDGALDVLFVRGGWEGPMRLSLMRNRGDATFEDVTVASGLSEPISTMAAVWGDYDNDGDLDLFVCGEYLSPYAETSGPDPRNFCRLYQYQGDGTFRDVAVKAGVTNERNAKGAAWGDYDDDGRLDLFVSNMGQECRLYHNEGDGTFRDAAPALGVTGPDLAFAAWFWDYDNDGRLDLYVNENKLFLAEEVAHVLGRTTERVSRPRLYRNLGSAGFRDVTAEVGLDRGLTPMGCNFGDIDNDGFLDFYLGTGGMSFEHLVPNRLFKNVAGQHFADMTTSSGTGHLQKGHGVSFADFNDDGALDLFVQVGGPAPGDKAYNLLFRNPGHGRHWLKVKLVGTKTNRAALGAKIRADVRNADGTTRSIYRTVGNNSSFGNNSLVESIGLLDSPTVAELTISWPTSRTTQTFRNIPADQSIEITEGTDAFKPLSRRN